MSNHSERLRRKQNHRKTTQLGVEQLESRLMNSIDSLESNLQLLNSPGLFGSTLLVSNTNTAPTVVSALRLNVGTEVTGRTAAVSVLGADNGGELNVRYNWQTTVSPAGGIVSFATNRTNAAKSNTLTFSKAGSYNVQVTIVDPLGLSTTSSLAINVVQTLSSLVIKTPDGRVVAPVAAITATTTTQQFTFEARDQFGAVMMSPEFVWQPLNPNGGGTATISLRGNSVTATFDRAGSYALRARSGAFTLIQSVNVVQSITSIRLTTTTGTAIDPAQAVSVTGTNQRLAVLGFDQFGNLITRLPNITWSTTAVPTGGRATGSVASGIATVAFTRAGAYTLRAASGAVSTSVSLNVSQVLTSVGALSSVDRPVVGTGVVAVTGATQSLWGRGLDQFGQVMTTQPTFQWSSIKSPGGATPSFQQEGVRAAVTFARAGLYTVRATSGNLSVNMSLNVVPTTTSLTVSPGTGSLQVGAKQQFSYRALDQFGQAIVTPPSVTWSTTAGTVSSAGVLSVGSTVGSFSITTRWGTIAGSASVDVVSQAPAPELSNAAIASLMGSIYADQQITRAEMISLLRSPGADGIVDSMELADLRLVVTGNRYAMPAYVRELARDVVHSNPANLRFKGQTAGNLAVGSSGTLLNNLVDKWFMGADEPAITGSYTYQTAAGNLFSGTPSRNDARQGALGDCYFIASLASIADKNPDAVRNLFIDNSDGTYTVRFYAGALGSFFSNGLFSSGFRSGSGTPDYVTVNRRLPADAIGRLAYSGFGQSIASATTTLWIALAEKAYAQWNETGNQGRDGTNRYAAMEGGWMSNVNAQVLGYNSTNSALSSASKQSLINAITSSQAVTIGTQTRASAGGLVGGHAYLVTGYNASTDTFSLYNPWGTTHPSQLTWAQLQANCSMFTVTNPSGSVANNLVSVKSSASDSLVGNWTTVLFSPEVELEQTDPLSFLAATEDEPLLGLFSGTMVANSEPVEIGFAGSTLETEGTSSESTEFGNPLASSLVDRAMSHFSMDDLFV